MPDNPTESAASDKPKRAYHRNVAPPPPSAAVSALENEVVNLIAQRSTANAAILKATEDASAVNARLQTAQLNLQQIEREVNYRLSIVAQMKGERPQEIHGAIAETYSPGFGVPAGVSSIAPPQPRIVQTGPRIRSESAENVRNVEGGVSVAI